MLVVFVCESASSFLWPISPQPASCWNSLQLAMPRPIYWPREASATAEAMSRFFFFFFRAFVASHGHTGEALACLGDPVQAHALVGLGPRAQKMRVRREPLQAKKSKRKWLCPGSNWGLSACKADAITN